MYVYDYDEYNKNNGVNIKMLEDFKKISSQSAKEIMNIIQKDQYDYKTYQKFQQMYTTDKKISSTRCTTRRGINRLFDFKLFEIRFKFHYLTFV